MKKTNIILVLLFFFNSLFVVAYAQINKVPASNKPIEYKQPDSTILTIVLRGDENLHWAETIDKYTLLSNSDGGYEYAKLDNSNNLIRSNKLAHNSEKRTKKEKRFLKKIPKELKFSVFQIKNSKSKN